MSSTKKKGKGRAGSKDKKLEDKTESDEQAIKDDELFCFFNVTEELPELYKQFDPSKLTTVIIVGQDEVTAEQIKCLTCVQELWITECNLEEVPYIKSDQLEKLYLHSNDLDYIPDLSYLTKLRVLWLNDNNIWNVENLCKCPTIEDLNLANNSIKYFDKLQNLPGLTKVNLSGNPISEIENVLKLKKIKTLKHLMLADPLYKTSPVANILNYRIIMVYHMPHLLSLDTFTICENEVKNAEEYYRIKKIHYSNVFHKMYNDYYEHLKKKIKLANSELMSIKDRLVRSILRERQALLSENNTLLEKCKWEQRHLDNDILRWDTSHKQQDRLQESIIQMNMKILDFEMSYAGNVQLLQHDSNSELSILCQQLFHDFTCPFTSKEAYVEKIVIDEVTHIVDKLTGSRQQLDIVNNMKVKGRSSRFFLLVDPVPVKNVNEWPFDLLKNFFERYSNEDYEKTFYTVTDCIAIADSSWLNSSEIHKKVFLTNEKNSKRIAVLICVPALIRVVKLDGDSDLHEESKAGSVKCCKYSVKASACYPAFIVQFHYIYQDLMKAYETLIKNEKIKESKQDASDPSILNYRIDELECNNWKNLVEISLTKCMLSTFGDSVTESYPNVKSLDVSFNHFEKLDEFGLIFPRLQSLNLSYNNLPNLASIKDNDFIEKLNISWNNLSKLCPNLVFLKLHAPSLKCLDVSYNTFDDVHFSWHEPYFAKKIIPFLRKYNDKWMTEFDSWQVKTFEGIYDLPVVEGEPSTHIAGCNAEWTGDAWCQIERTRGSHVCVSPTDRSVSCLSLVGGQHFHQLRFSLPLPGLTSLTVSTNLLQDVSFLAGLPQLRRLDLSKNTLTSTEVSLVNNPHILYLDLSCNYFASLDFINKSNLLKLKVLNVSMNKLKSLKGIERCNNLEQLYVTCNNLVSYEGIKTIKHLQKLIIIDLSCNKLPSLRDTKKYIADTIKTIEYINGSQLNDSELVETPSSNSSLDADYLLRFYKITALHNLNELSVPKAYISKVNLDGGVVNHLTSINLEGNQLDRLCDLACLPNLTNLCLSHNKVKRFRGRDEDYVENTVVFEKLDTLHLDDNGLTEIEGLELYRMPVLKTLFLQDNLISSLAGLYKAKSLSNLILDRNRLRTIQPVDVTGLHTLSQLYLENNFLENLQFLSSIPKLTKLFIANNRIYDFVNLHWLSCTKQITELTISGNPVNSCGTLLKFLLQTLPQLALLNGYNIK